MLEFKLGYHIINLEGAKMYYECYKDLCSYYNNGAINKDKFNVHLKTILSDLAQLGYAISPEDDSLIKLSGN